MLKTPRKTAKTLTTVIALTLLALAPSAQALDGPLSDEVRATLGAIPSDPAPKRLVRGNHYLISNEDRPHLFHDVLAKRGGTLVGVGTDQLYVYAGWARSELIIPMDFDAVVVDLHRVYMKLFTRAATPKEFLDQWHRRNAKTVLAWLEAETPDPALRKRIRYVYKLARQLVYARLKRMHLRYRNSKTPTFMSDQVQYDHLVALVTQGRIYPVRGDLTKSGCLKGIGDALRTTGRTLDLIYLSNAEQYFSFGDDFRQNFFDLPVDDTSLVLRTAPLNRGGLYRYESQRTLDFQAWLRRPKVTRVKQIRRHRQPGWQKDAYVFPGPPK